jgi:hypothetical protein
MRLSATRLERTLGLPVFGALLRLSGGEPLSEAAKAAAEAGREAFLRRYCVGFVVVDRARAAPDLEAFAMEVLVLDVLHRDDRYTLYAPRDPPPCDGTAAPLDPDGADR